MYVLFISSWVASLALGKFFVCPVPVNTLYYYILAAMSVTLFGGKMPIWPYSWHMSHHQYIQLLRNFSYTLHIDGACRLVSVGGTAVLVYYHVVKPLHDIGRSVTRIWNLLSCRNGGQVDMSYFGRIRMVKEASWLYYSSRLQYVFVIIQ